MEKRALITGAGKRIGRELALYLGTRGWDIAIHYHRSEEEAHSLTVALHAMGRKTALIAHDLRHAAQAGHIVEQATQALGPLHALIHNAANFGRDTLETLSNESWSAHMEVNLHSALHITQAFAAQFPSDEAQTGNVIYLTDGMKGWSLSANFLSYALSKMGLANAIELLAPALAPTIRINGVAPGPTLPGPQDSPDTFDKLKTMSPPTSTADICHTVDFILHAPALTGQIIPLHNGLWRTTSPVTEKSPES